ncbi:MAG: hypothetical protein ACYCYP_10275 [Leptospirales bacterium]
METMNQVRLFFKFFFGIILWLFAWGVIDQDLVYGGNLTGPAPSGATEGGLFSPPLPPTNAAPGGFGGQIDSPGSPGYTGQNQNGQANPQTPGQNVPANQASPTQTQGTQNQNISPAPTFMNGALPNTSNPFLPSNVSPGLISGPMENQYIQSGVPALAAPLMSAVYRPFGLTYFQPDPFQVIPEGYASLTGTFETDTNINFSPNQPEMGSLFSIMPAVMYSNFDNYGYLSLLANASYYQYTSGNIPSYLDEMGGISAGTYLGTRVFVGAQDFFINGSTPQMTGSPFAFFNGINPYYENMGNAEIGIALTPKITFVQGASDMYFDMSGYGAGIMNIQSLTEAINYLDQLDFLSATYTYLQGTMSLFPSFISNGVSGSGMRKISSATSFGPGGNAAYYIFQNAPTDNFEMISYYGIISHTFSKSIIGSLEGGWNITTIGGQTFQAPLVDLNLGYSGAHLSLGVNAGEFQMNGLSYGIEMGPENTYDAIGYLSYSLGSKTTFFSSAGYTYYQMYSAYNFSNNFFTTLQPNINYDGAYFDQSDGIFYTPYSWLQTSLTYNFIDYSTNIPNETIMDNQFIGMVTFKWQFH